MDKSQKGVDKRKECSRVGLARKISGGIYAHHIHKLERAVPGRAVVIHLLKHLCTEQNHLFRIGVNGMADNGGGNRVARGRWLVVSWGGREGLE